MVDVTVSGTPHGVGSLVLVLVWLLSSGLFLLPVDPAYSGAPDDVSVLQVRAYH